MKISKTWAAAAAFVALSGAAQAALIDRGSGLIYDDVRNITWLADMNYAKTSGYDADGKMNWAAAIYWAENVLTYGGYTDWRLPTFNPSDTTCTKGAGNDRYGYNCTQGELSHLFVTDLGRSVTITNTFVDFGEGGGYTQSDITDIDDTVEQQKNLTLFRNMQSDRYWSGTANALIPDSPRPWFFDNSSGYQDYTSTAQQYYALAVRPGDVAAAVPEPGSLALVSLALMAVFGLRRKWS